MDHVARFAEPSAEPPRDDVAPQVFERDDAPGHGGGRHAEHRAWRAQAKPRGHAPLPGPDELAMHRLTYAEGMDVEAVLRRRPEASDELDLCTRHRNAGTVAVAVV